MTSNQKLEIDEKLTLTQICAARNVMAMQNRMQGDKAEQSVFEYLQNILGNPSETALVHPREFYKNHKLAQIASGLTGSIKRSTFFNLTSK